MFPYPSGAGLHIGHPEGYVASDILARYKKACGFNVLHPMGWDAFGLPAEQYAIKTGTHPSETTRNNVENFRRQIKSIGFAIDWDREINTTDPRLLQVDPVDIPEIIQGGVGLRRREARVVVRRTASGIGERGSGGRQVGSGRTSGGAPKPATGGAADHGLCREAACGTG